LQDRNVFAIEEIEPDLLRLYTKNREEQGKKNRKKGGRKVAIVL